jgi:hypothetical protein
MPIIVKGKNVKTATLLLMVQRELLNFLGEPEPDYFHIDTAIAVLDSMLNEYRKEVLDSEVSNLRYTVSH